VSLQVQAGQKLGCFALGGSSIALFFNRKVAMLQTLRELQAKVGMDIKLQCAENYANVCS
jgi:hypothetical protein